MFNSQLVLVADQGGIQLGMCIVYLYVTQRSTSANVPLYDSLIKLFFPSEKFFSLPSCLLKFYTKNTNLKYYLCGSLLKTMGHVFVQ